MSHATVEMQGIDDYRELHPEHTYCFPQGQNTHVDLLQGETAARDIHTFVCVGGGEYVQRTGGSAGHSGDRNISALCDLRPTTDRTNISCNYPTHLCAVHT